MKPNPDIEIHIDEIVLHGFPARNKAGIDNALRNELALLLARYGAPAILKNGGAVPLVPGGTFKTSSHESSKSIGKSIARSIYSGLKRS